MLQEVCLLITWCNFKSYLDGVILCCLTLKEFPLSKLLHSHTVFVFEQIANWPK